ncbi:hypothetical protein BH09ACT12_BH09ACT12_37520 [soil metagenome]
MTRRSGALGVGLSVVICLALASCSSDSTPGDPDPSSPGTPTETATSLPQEPPAKLAKLSYGVFGSDAEVASYQDVVDAYNAQATTGEFTLRSWPSSRAMMRAIDSGADVPDLYQVTRARLGDVVDAGRNVPLFSLLEDRDVSYGDNYPLDTIEAFSRGNDLQCMPYAISPTVMYINTDLVDFERMRLRGLPAPDDELRGWNIEEFAAAVQFATRPRLKTRGLSIAPTLAGIAPYLYSGGGTLFDDDSAPTSLDLESGDNQESLATLLALARNPLTTLTDTQLKRASPLEWFERGRIGVLAGDRSIVPDLRDVPGLSFDVMPMPRVGRTATTCDVTGICISPGGEVQRAADFLVHVISADGFAPVAEAGYVVPANTSVARSEAFLQPDQQPESSGVFNLSVDAMELLPLAAEDPELRAAVAPLIRKLFTVTLPPDIEAATEAIDEVSRSIIDPTYVPETPSESPSESPSGFPSPAATVSPDP